MSMFQHEPHLSLHMLALEIMLDKRNISQKASTSISSEPIETPPLLAIYFSNFVQITCAVYFHNSVPAVIPANSVCMVRRSLNLIGKFKGPSTQNYFL